MREDKKIYEDYLKELRRDGKIVSPRLDFIFKKFMKDRRNRKYLCFLLTNLFDIDEEYLEENLVFSDSELIKDTLSEKGKRCDLIVSVKNNEIILEMNNNSSKYQKNKTILYTTNLLNSSFKKNDEYSEERYVKAINFNYNVGGIDDRFKSDVALRYKDGTIYSEMLQLVEINLEKLEKVDYNSLNRFERALIIFVEERKARLIELFEGDEMMMSALEILDEYTNNITAADAIAYLQLRDEERCRNSLIREAREAKEKAHAEGLAEGKAEGKAEGREDALINVAKKMLENKHEISEIVQLTGLSKEKIEKLQVQV